MTTHPIRTFNGRRTPIASRYVCLTDFWTMLQWVDINDKRTPLNLIDVLAHADEDTIDAVKIHVDVLRSILATTFDWALILEMHAKLLAAGLASYDELAPAWQLAEELEDSIESYQQAVDDLAGVMAGVHSPEPTMEWPFEPWLLWWDASEETQVLGLDDLDAKTCQRLGLPAVLATATCVLAQLRRAERQMRTVVETEAADQPSHASSRP